VLCAEDGRQESFGRMDFERWERLYDYWPTAANMTCEIHGVMHFSTPKSVDIGPVFLV
jgi:hypothetical protein